MTRKRKKTRTKARGRSRKGQLPEPIALPRREAWVMLVLLLIGVLISLYLTYVHYRMHADPGWRSACDIDPRVSCDAVVLSSYGSIRGMPLSILGTWFYLVGTAVVVAAIRRSHWGVPRSPAVVVFLGGALATGVSVFLAVISIAWIGSICPLCVIVYAINIAITATAWHALRSGEGVLRAAAMERAHWRANRALSVTLSLGALALLGAGVVVYSHSPGGSSVCDGVARAASSDHSLELVIFTDFQCPHCQKVAAALKSILGARQSAIRFVLRHYPLDAACNPHAKHSPHPGSCRLALAAICADAQGKQAEFSDSAFESPGDVDRIAAAIGLDKNKFDACLTSEAASRMLQTSIEDAAARDVHSTPTLFVNGRRHVGRLDDADLRCLANAASWPATPARP